ncbi:PTS transporter subunit EIIB [Vibrio kanaloae]|uniref:PTS EIIB type-1 domain-containing protein n=1 Tax=Vibrio kanaloae TaxID=170673 RepID=A0A4U1ZTY2_9VIBR|nr:PTS transporter subunit EIIB [Vibrio kanaloae]TKE97499.1 hypothetical protein FCV44_08980 [Vibrio kanaloae]TKF17041.1 hypothetical protein FCV47_08920 [Vibrio kanaloae]TKF28864.1 hypothetical protein FCV52_01415 [Vibrio kanaloae]TKF37276.1 hypothetical protein FCV50_00935 [Vibrio kanaloae]TKF78767.1 hypothetical protein FCV62_11085 [Vibrio kanaloae]
MIRDKGDIKVKASKIILALGGVDNIVKGNIDNCATRLRIQIRDLKLIDDKSLRKQGALGFIRLPDNHIQVVFLNVHEIAEQLREIVDS